MSRPLCTGGRGGIRFSSQHDHEHSYHHSANDVSSYFRTTTGIRLKVHTPGAVRNRVAKADS